MKMAMSSLEMENWFLGLAGSGVLLRAGSGLN